MFGLGTILSLSFVQQKFPPSLKKAKEQFELVERLMAMNRQLLNSLDNGHVTAKNSTDKSADLYEKIQTITNESNQTNFNNSNDSAKTQKNLIDYNLEAHKKRLELAELRIKHLEDEIVEMKVRMRQSMNGHSDQKQ